MQSQTLETKAGAKVFYTQRGDGDELVVFLHAVGGDHASWQPQIESLSGKYTCVSLDFRGHGKSSLINGGSVTIESFAGDTVELIGRLGFARAHLVGLSMGGVVALEVFRQAPHLVQSLALANSWSYMADAEGRIAFMREQLSKMSIQESASQLIPGLFAPGTKKDIVDATIRTEGSKDPKVFLASWESMFQVDYREMLPSIDVPVLLIGGTEDKVTPTDPLLTTIYNLVPFSQLVNIEGAGHFSNLDHEAEFTALLRVHLNRARLNQSQRLGVPKPSKQRLQADTVAQALIGLLPRRGVEFFFSNSGTDFTPIIDALARYQSDEDFTLKTVVAPHENTAIGMAHGAFLLSGQAQAVMAHVNVGTANMGLGIINAARSRIPMLVLAGKTPWYESDVDGCRTNFVQWGQDTFDQGAYFREFTKWDYELKGPHNLETVVDRALAITESDPAGPVYLTLPKESLCARVQDFEYSTPSRQQKNSEAEPSSDAIARAAELIAAAKKPLLITAEAGRYRRAPETLVQLADKFGIPVIEHGKHNFFNFPTNHSMHLGFNPSPYVEQADLIIVLESHVPWIPALSKVPTPPRIVQVGVDPLCQNIPMRSFPVDVSLAGHPAKSLKLLAAKLADLIDEGSVKARRDEVSAEHNRLFAESSKAASADANHNKITKRFLSYSIGQAIDDQCVIFNEYDLDPQLVPRRLPDSWFENSIASGLGWSLGAALGAQLASPDQTMVVTLGDGSYLFNTPVSAHYVAAAYQLPIVIVIFNDSGWTTIKKSYLGTTPGGWATKMDPMPLTAFDVPIKYDMIAESCGGVGITVEEPSELAEALKKGIQTARDSRKHVLLNIICEKDG